MDLGASAHAFACSSEGDLQIAIDGIVRAGPSTLIWARLRARPRSEAASDLFRTLKKEVRPFGHNEEYPLSERSTHVFSALLTSR